MDRRIRGALRMDDPLSPLYTRLSEAHPHSDRPFVTLTFAQTIDGSISATPGEKTRLSGEASMTMTHRLRTLHDAILVGIGTVLADDPQLTARRVEGPDPQPIVVDSQLRTPPDCRLMTSDLKPWIACAHMSNPQRKSKLESMGAQLLPTPQNDHMGLDLEALAQALRRRGVGRLMVEGGARIIHSFLQSDLVDLIVITLAPRMLDGLRPYSRDGASSELPDLLEPHWVPAGHDMILWARPGEAER